MQIFDVIIHFDQHMNVWIAELGPWMYTLVFCIILGESGLVLLPFLPGDSLLFALGALTVPGSPLQYSILVPLLIVAAILGGFLNYFLGHYFSTRLFEGQQKPWINYSHLEKTRIFYKKHGGKTIFIARFIPVIRTFAPFVAGIGKMSFQQFSFVNILGGIFWIFSMTTLGRLFGNLPIVKNNFGLVIPLIIVISALPIVFEIWGRKKKPNAPSEELL